MFAPAERRRGASRAGTSFGKGGTSSVARSPPRCRAVLQAGFYCIGGISHPTAITLTAISMVAAMLAAWSTFRLWPRRLHLSPASLTPIVELAYNSAAVRMEVFDRAYDLPGRRKLELLPRAELAAYIRRFIRFKAATDGRISRGIEPIPSPPNTSPRPASDSYRAWWQPSDSKRTNQLHRDDLFRVELAHRLCRTPPPVAGCLHLVVHIRRQAERPVAPVISGDVRSTTSTLQCDPVRVVDLATNAPPPLGVLSPPTTATRPARG